MDTGPQSATTTAGLPDTGNVHLILVLIGAIRTTTTMTEAGNSTKVIGITRIMIGIANVPTTGDTATITVTMMTARAIGIADTAQYFAQ